MTATTEFSLRPTTQLEQLTERSTTGSPEVGDLEHALCVLMMGESAGETLRMDSASEKQQELHLSDDETRSASFIVDEKRRVVRELLSRAAPAQLLNVLEGESLSFFVAQRRSARDFSAVWHANAFYRGI